MRTLTRRLWIAFVIMLGLGATYAWFAVAMVYEEAHCDFERNADEVAEEVRAFIVYYHRKPKDLNELDSNFGLAKYDPELRVNPKSTKEYALISLRARRGVMREWVYGQSTDYREK
jgi:hypothetical protein